MQLLFTVLLFFTFANAAYDAALLNKFSGDVDIYDMGTMGRGKNAGSWHRSPDDNQEVFYYLAMQPWRHLVWTIKEGNDWFTYVLNEDASNIPAAPSGKNPSPKVSNNDANDYCRKEYTTPMAKFDIDWDRVDAQSKLESLEINGITCYRYPAKIPLENIYLQQQYSKPRDVAVMTPCRYDFIGGKSITFRSFNSFSSVFIGNSQPNGYQLNRTRCNIDPTPFDVKTDLAIILGISDATIVQKINNQLSILKNIPNVQQRKIYYMSGDSAKAEVIGKDEWDTLKLKQITESSVDALINTAKNDLIKRRDSGAIYRGTMIVLMDQMLNSNFDAETAFDRNFITVHPVIYNTKSDKQMAARARSLLSLGQHYHEFTSADEVESIVTEMYNGVRANLTERCDRRNCDGFCDARDRCTCPMCCENTCFFTYCDTAKATCTPWPKGKPKEKITCKDDCVGKQECRDLEGCVYKEYNPGCEPRAKCMRPYCDDKNKCQQESACEKDKTPSYENKCWSYYCNEQTGNCERQKSGATCPPLTSLCEEHVCHDDLSCEVVPKTCVKTSPYIEMKCYQAKCNKKTGMCENVLSCDVYSSCGATGTKDLCTCDPKTFACSCKKDTSGYCNDNQVCDSRGEEPKCIESKCGQDLYQDGCQIKTCNEETKQIEWVDVDCSKQVEFQYSTPVKDLTPSDVAEYCSDKYEIYCDEGNCFGRKKFSASESAACGKCTLQGGYEEGAEETDSATGKKYKKKIYRVVYTERCDEKYPTCIDGSNSTTLDVKKFKEGSFSKCAVVGKGDDGKDIHQCVFNEPEDVFDYCSGCYSNKCYLAKEYVKYTYNSKTGYCDQVTLNEPPHCSKCRDDNKGYDITCVNEKFTQTYLYPGKQGEKEVKYDYQIPKKCVNDQCIPVLDYNCMSTTDNNGVKAIVELLAGCVGLANVKGTYHYSAKFDQAKYYNGQPQSDEFVAEMEKEAYCEWTFTETNCHYCSVVPQGESVTLESKDMCKELEEKNKELITSEELKKQYFMTCNPTTNECEPPERFRCKNQNCRKMISTGVTCVHKTDEEYEGDLCGANQEKIDTTVKAYIDSVKGKNTPIVSCKAHTECDLKTNETCALVYDNVECENAYQQWVDGKDFGCWIPKKECNENTYHCDFVEMTHPTNDSAAFLKNTDVVFGDLCYQYRCKQECKDNVCTHKWEQTEESKAELYALPTSVCDTVKCDPKTGKAVHEEMKCTPVEAFKMTEAQAQCFECKCSYVDGKPQIVMRSSLGAETYELDACGNCIVRDRQTGEQKNEHVECVLSVTVNLTGAIAGATVAASVVFGLIGAMVVVSIGAFQTYQLVASAMKNVISTTLENPEFVAADNEATNVLNNE